MGRNENNSGTDIALVAVFAALLAVFAVVPGVPVPGSSVPITLQTLGVLLCGLVLGPWRGALSVLLYLLVGFAGIPVFAQGSGGLSVFASPSIGYLLSFPLAALAAGGLAAWFVRSGLKGRYLWLSVAAAVGSFLVIDVAGIAGMMVVAQLDLPAAFLANLPFVLGDAVKCFAAAAVAVAVNKAFPVLLASRKPVSA
ncbi:MAG: biotin transporter BioY [Propionibacteriaceae bacterium]|jgi:biotin transport system substrate-specific component|nr:biotin transporter BioY [Propionibacteriaceae bacterium]